MISNKHGKFVANKLFEDYSPKDIKEIIIPELQKRVKKETRNDSS